MKKLLSALLLTATLAAATVSFVWDDTENPPTTRYRLYELSGTNVVRIAESAEKTMTISLSAGQHQFIVRAVSVEGIESDNSNELPLFVPHAVTIRILVVP